MGRLRNQVIMALLLLATVHCVRSIFLVNVSLLDLPSYARGTERMPFQGRIAMMPLLRWAPTSPAVVRVAAWFDSSLTHVPRFATPPEHVTPEKLVSIAASLIATSAAVLFAIAWGRRRTPQLWWLPATLQLGMLYVTYAARYEAQYWYPYDLPHFALFGMAAVCMLEGWYAAAFALFLADLPMRETAISLVPLLAAAAWARQDWKPLRLAVAMLVLWLALRVAIVHRFALNAVDTGIHLGGMAAALANPLHWAQWASAFGFLAIPLWWNRQALTPEERRLALGAIPGLALATLFGVWYETRIYDEWILPAACLLSLQVARQWIYCGITLADAPLQLRPQHAEQAVGM